MEIKQNPTLNGKSTHVSGDESTHEPSPYSPQPGDEKLNRGKVFIDSLELTTNALTPLLLKLSKPTPCHVVRVEIDQSNVDNIINVEVYSLIDPNTDVCSGDHF